MKIITGSENYMNDFLNSVGVETFETHPLYDSSAGLYDVAVVGAIRTFNEYFIQLVRIITI